MQPIDSIRSTFGLSDMVLTSYISDLTDEELMKRPGTGCNHIAWQLGHLISSEGNLLNMVKDGSAIELPEGFADKHSKDAASNDDAASFCGKDEYLELYQKTRANSLAVIGAMSDAELDAEGPEAFRQMCATVGEMVSLIATHPMMHVGQFVPVRRACDKPVLI